MSERPLRLLLVEDSPDDALLLQDALDEAFGSAAEVIHVDRLAAALDVLAPHPEPLRAVALRRWDADARTVVQLA